MATVHHFEDLDIWKKSQELGLMVYELCANNKQIARDFSFMNQIKGLGFLFPIILQKVLNTTITMIFTAFYE